jgi:hypothetical protein
MVWVRKTLTTGESDPENALGHAVGLRVAEWFVVEPPLGNQISHTVCCAFSCGNQDVEEKIVPVMLSIFFRSPKSPLAEKLPLCTVYQPVSVALGTIGRCVRSRQDHRFLIGKFDADVVVSSELRRLVASQGTS